jgi:hypothetical protein
VPCFSSTSPGGSRSAMDRRREAPSETSTRRH